MFCLRDAAAEPMFVGYEGCQMCHRDEFADWERSKHAKAFELLKAGARKAAKHKADLEVDKDYTRSDKCIKCHTTGYNRPGGYVSLSETPTRAGIGCEMCHGPGSEYRLIHRSKHAGFTREEVMAAGQTYGSVDPKVCRQCHENEDTPMQPKVDKKYVFVLEERLQDYRAFHKLYGKNNP
jgi:hypothetical protein